MTPSLRSREERNATQPFALPTQTMPPTDEIEQIKRQRRQLSSLITERQRRRLHKLQSLQTVANGDHSQSHQTDKESESGRARAKRRCIMDRPPPIAFEDIQGPQGKSELAKEAGGQEEKGVERNTVGAATEAEVCCGNCYGSFSSHTITHFPYHHSFRSYYCYYYYFHRVSL